MRMQIDAPRHHDHASGIEVLIDASTGFRIDQPAVAHVQIAAFAVDAVGRIVECAAPKPCQAHGWLLASDKSDNRAAMAATVGSSVARVAVSGATTEPSMRNRWPPLSTPGVATGMNTVDAARAPSKLLISGCPSTMTGTLSARPRGSGSG